jgi:integration host factor subunit alpha
MASKTLTRADLADAVVQKVGLPRNESQDLVELILEEISVTLASGEAVKLSSFGSFGIREKGQRVGRNPKTGKEVPITPRRVLVFRPSNVMKERINVGVKRGKETLDAKPAQKSAKPSSATKSAAAPATTGNKSAGKSAAGSTKTGKASGKVTSERQA